MMRYISRNGANFLTAAGTAALLFTASAFAQPNITEVQKLLASDGTASDKFGIALDREGDLLIIGAPENYPNGLPGSFYVFTRNADGAWIEQQRVFSEFEQGDDEHGDEFGGFLSLEGDTLLISATIANKSYIYTSDETGSWSFFQQLDVPGASLGGEVALIGETAVVVGHDGSQAKGYLFSPDQSGVWVHDQTLDLGMLDQPQASGKHLFFDGEIIAISDGIGGQITPVIAFFSNDGDDWTFDYSLTMPITLALGTVGGLAVEDDTLAVGLIEATQNPPDHVRIYEQDKAGASAPPEWGGVLDPTSVYTDDFGAEISLAGNLMLIGAPHDNGPGGVWVYQRSEAGGWSILATLGQSDPQFSHNFGVEISFVDNLPVIGTWAHHENGLYAGAVYVFDQIPAPVISGDLDNDGDVDVTDLLDLLDAWGTDGAGADIAPPDNMVDVFDLLELFENWG